MAFYDIVTEMGYKVSNLNDIIDISKEEIFVDYKPIGEIHIVFYKSKKEIIGYVKPLSELFDVDEVSRLYRLFLSMKKDLKFFADKSKYVII